MDADKRRQAHRRMLDEIAADALDTANWTGRARFSEAVMAAMAAVPRHRFVRPEHAPAAYANRPQAIGHGQTISQPYIVALIADMLDLKGDEKVLEIGAGSGYQAAVLAEVLKTGALFTIEVVAALEKQARHRLADLGYRNIAVRHGDGFLGWPEQAPFDAIAVSAAPERLPTALVAQLKPGGRMAAPIGRANELQYLCLARKREDGRVTVDRILPVAFVPMVKPRK